VIWTSYYGNWRKFPKGCLRASVSIAKPNAECVDFEIKPFFPTWELIDEYRKDRNEDYYADGYLQLLNSREGAGRAALKLKEMESRGRDVLLLCWESKGFCHRKLLANWLNSEYGMSVSELPKDGGANDGLEF